MAIVETPTYLQGLECDPAAQDSRIHKPDDAAREKPSTCILLVEDNDGHAELISLNLRRAGVTNPIFRVVDGEDAMAFANREGKYAARCGNDSLLMVLDLELPGMSGFDVLRSLKANPEHRDIAVFTLTTSSDVVDCIRSRTLGSCGHASKWAAFLDFHIFVQKLAEVARLNFATSGPNAGQ